MCFKASADESESGPQWRLCCLLLGRKHLCLAAGFSQEIRLGKAWAYFLDTIEWPFSIVMLKDL